MANVKWIQANQSQTKAGNYKKKLVEVSFNID